jgi:hypothetical protein
VAPWEVLAVDTGTGYHLLQDIDGGPPGVALPTGPTTSTTEVEDDVDGKPPGGRCRWVWQEPPPRSKTTSMAGPLRALSAGPVASTTEVEEDVDCGPPGGRCRRVWQRPPPRLKTTSMVPP